MHHKRVLNTPPPLFFALICYLKELVAENPERRGRRREGALWSPKQAEKLGYFVSCVKAASVFVARRPFFLARKDFNKLRHNTTDKLN